MLKCDVLMFCHSYDLCQPPLTGYEMQQGFEACFDGYVGLLHYHMQVSCVPLLNYSRTCFVHTKHCRSFQKYSAFLAAFTPVVRPPYFGLERGPLTSPGPAMVRTDRKDLNSNKTKTNKKQKLPDSFRVMCF